MGRAKTGKITLQVRVSELTAKKLKPFPHSVIEKHLLLLTGKDYEQNISLIEKEAELLQQTSRAKIARRKAAWEGQIQQDLEEEIAQIKNTEKKQ